MRDALFALSAANQSRVAYLAQTAQWRSGVLGTLCFCGDARGELDAEAPCLQVAMRRLDGSDLCEAWHGVAPLTQGQRGEIRYRHDDNVMFGVLALPESRFDGSAGKTPLQQATESAYREVFALMETLGYPHLYRCWNYFPGINSHSFGTERYRQFNLGRQAAFAVQGFDNAMRAPAASALGSAQGPLSIAFMAGRVAPLQIENPRQVSAYAYPPQYGPRSPIFSRATLLRTPQSALLWISGTASIVGHASMHPGDVDAQLSETFSNISAVLAEANQLEARARFTLSGLGYKVYVRRATDLARIHAGLQRHVGSALNAAYIEADVCREELLLEIEASAVATFPPPTGGTD